MAEVGPLAGVLLCPYIAIQRYVRLYRGVKKKMEKTVLCRFRGLSTRMVPFWALHRIMLGARIDSANTYSTFGFFLSDGLLGGVAGIARRLVVVLKCNYHIQSYS